VTGRLEELGEGFVWAPHSRQQKTLTVSERPVQELSIAEASVTVKALDFRSDQAEPVFLRAWGSVEGDVPPGLGALLALAFRPLDAATSLRVQPPFRARTGDGR
jgi:hypothetical protein